MRIKGTERPRRDCWPRKVHYGLRKMEETQKSGSKLFWDPANCRTSRAAGFMGIFLLDRIFHPAPHFFFR